MLSTKGTLKLITPLKIDRRTIDAIAYILFFTYLIFAAKYIENIKANISIETKYTADISPEAQQAEGHINVVHIMKLQFRILFTGASESIYITGF